MAQANLDAMRRVYEAMARGDFWAAREVFDPDISWEWSASWSGMTGVDVYQGIEGVEKATRDWFEPWDWFWQEAEEFIEVGEDVLVLTRVRGRPKGSDREIESKAGELWTFRDGKVIRHRSFDSPSEALEAVGLGE
jgi:ketosteroid isomerase-like protein